MEELKSRLDQCLAFNGINKEIEIISLKLESISNQKLSLESQDENDAISYKEGLKVTNNDTSKYKLQLKILNRNCATIWSL